MRLVNLLEPELCLACRFCAWTEVEGKRTIQCLRRDCDNWERKSTPIPITRVDLLAQFPDPEIVRRAQEHFGLPPFQGQFAKHEDEVPE